VTSPNAPRAEELAASSGAVVVPPFDDLRRWPRHAARDRERSENVGMVLFRWVAGLSSGVATAIKLRHPSARVIGVEPEWSTQAGCASGASRSRCPARPDSRWIARCSHWRSPAAHLARYRDDVVQVDDAPIRRAVILLDRMKLVAEPSGDHDGGDPRRIAMPQGRRLPCWRAATSNGTA
jgi:threonine dehydratase